MPKPSRASNDLPSASFRVWLVVRWPHDLRFFAPVVGALTTQGHEIEISIAVPNPKGDTEESLRALTAVIRSASGGQSSQIGWLAPLERGRRRRFLTMVRNARSYAERAPHWNASLRARWRGHLPRLLRRAIKGAERMRMRMLVENRLVRASLGALERALPPPRVVTERLRAIRPDVVVVSPMVYPEMTEIEALKAARRAGIPTIGFVLSWDNLTSKGCFPVRPDRLLVWNQIQHREAVELHQFPAGRVEVVGAPVFDYLYDRSYRLKRDEWLRRAGIPRSSRYVTYAVSSTLCGLGGELDFVRRLADEIGLEWEWSDERPWILVRPHPRNAEGWEAFSERHVAVWRSHGFPESEQARTDLSNTLAHGDAVLGFNTSLFVEAAAVGKPCISLAAIRDVDLPDLEHFRYLLEAGFLHLPDSEAEAASLLAEIQRRGDSLDAARADFAASFVRPGGATRPAGEVAAERIVDFAKHAAGNTTSERQTILGSAHG